MLLMDIRQVKADGHDYSLSVPLSILPGLNADSTIEIYCMYNILIKYITNQGPIIW